MKILRCFYIFFLLFSIPMIIKTGNAQRARTVLLENPQFYRVLETQKGEYFGFTRRQTKEECPFPFKTALLLLACSILMKEEDHIQHQRIRQDDNGTVKLINFSTNNGFK